MSRKYENVTFWNELLTVSPRIRVKALELENDSLTDIFQDNKVAFMVWKVFLSSEKVNAEVCKWLLSVRPEVTALNCPFPILHEERSFEGCTLFQLILLIRPCHEYLDVIEYTSRLCDADGNSSLFYAAFADKPDIYERVWKLVGDDGRNFRRPGPEYAPLLVRAGWTHIVKTQISVPRLIKSLGGLKAAMNFAVKENSLTFANELLKQLRDTDWDECVEILMHGSFVHFKTFLEIVEEAMEQTSDLKATPQEIIQRAHALCEKDTHRKHFLKLVTSVKEHFALRKSLDELVEFLGMPYQLLFYVYQYPTCMIALQKISSRNPPPPEVFDLRSKVLGSYLHFLCKLIGSFEPFHKIDSMHSNSLKRKYIPNLLKVSKHKHWTVTDADGYKPMHYLGKLMDCIRDTPFANEIQRRNDSDKVPYSPYLSDEAESSKPKDSFCCVF